MFAGAYVALQVGRNLAGMLLLRRGEPLRPLFELVVVWSCASGILRIAGALVASSARFALWGPALAVDLVVPWVGFRTPVARPLESRGLGC